MDHCGPSESCLSYWTNTDFLINNNSIGGLICGRMHYTWQTWNQNFSANCFYFSNMDSQGGYEIGISVLIVSSSVTWTAKEVMTSELQCFMFLLDVLSFCCVYSTTESTDMEVVEAELCIYCSEISLFSVQEAILCCCEGHITKIFTIVNTTQQQRPMQWRYIHVIIIRLVWCASLSYFNSFNKSQQKCILTV